MLKKISVIGLGYIGLPTAALLASRSNHVIGVDVNPSVVETINQGKIHIVETHLNELVKNTVEKGSLKAVTAPEPADIFIITVPTPIISIASGKYAPDLSYIESAVESISTVLKIGDVVILESTSPVGTTEKISEMLANLRPDLDIPQLNSDDSDIYIAYCPERVLPGQILQELVENDRIIGGLTRKSSEKTAKFYEHFVEGTCHLTDARTAELSKLAENSSRDVQIAFANELSMICDELTIETEKVIALANRHPRVNILKPGPGVGGHCIAVDPWFIVSSAPNSSRLIKTAREINDFKPIWVFNKILSSMEANNLTSVVCMGLTYKPNVDDIRESPALRIYKMLEESSEFEVFAVDPFCSISNVDVNLINIESIPQNSLIVGLVAHSEFRKIDFKTSKVLDFAGIWDN